jgi:hypothetical protein
MAEKQQKKITKTYGKHQEVVKNMDHAINMMAECVGRFVVMEAKMQLGGIDDRATLTECMQRALEMLTRNVKNSIKLLNRITNVELNLIEQGNKYLREVNISLTTLQAEHQKLMQGTPHSYVDIVNLITYRYITIVRLNHLTIAKQLNIATLQKIDVTTTQNVEITTTTN